MLGFEFWPRKAKEARRNLQMEIISILKIGQPDFLFNQEVEGKCSVWQDYRSCVDRGCVIQTLVWEWYFTWTRLQKTGARVPFTGNHGVGELCRGLPWNSAPRPLFWILFESLRIGDPWFEKTQDKHRELYCFLMPGSGSGISDTTSHWKGIIEEGG